MGDGLRRAVGFGVGLLVMLVPCAASGQQDRGPVRRALLVGVGEYPLLREALPEAYEREIRLLGPENDVALMREVLERVGGFHPTDIRTLVGWSEDVATRPTRAAILAGLAELAEHSRPGDFALFFFAGHGTQQPVRRADPLHEPDGLDEVLLPADVARFEPERGGIPGAILDDELGAAAQAIRDRGAQVWFIVDACHSATLLRGESGGDGLRLRGVEPSLLGAPPPSFALRSGPASGPAPSPDLSSIAAFHGAQSYGRAPELDIPLEDGAHRRHGLFTWLLAQELVRTGGRASYRELLRRVVAAYQAWPCHLTVPGADGDLDRDIWSGVEGGGRPIVTRTPENELRLDRGLLAGVGPGALLDLGEDDAVSFRAEVVDAGPFEARCELIEGELPEGLWSFPARIVSKPLPDATLPWALVDEAGGELDVARIPEATRRRLFEDEGRAASFPLVAPERAVIWVVHDGATWRLRPRADAGGQDLLLDGARSLDRDLARVARARNLVGFAGAGLTAALPEGLEVWAEVRRAGRGAPRALAPGETIAPGDELRVRARKRSTAIVDLNVFFIDSHHGVTAIYPRAGNSPRLPADVAGELTLLDWTPLVDNSLGIEHVLAIAQARAASDPVLDLGFLAQSEIPRLRSGADPLAELLAGIARAEPTRGIGISAATAMPLGSALTTLRLDWSDLGPPEWPRGGALIARGGAAESTVPAFAQPADLPPGFASPLVLGERTSFARSPGSRGACDVLLSGATGGAAELVLLDFGAGVAPDADPNAALASGAFQPRAAFRFEPERRVAYYASRAGGPFEQVLVDSDGDGLAEERWVLEDDVWRREAPLAVPWLSQTWAQVEDQSTARIHATRVLSILCASSRRTP